MTAILSDSMTLTGDPEEDAARWFARYRSGAMDAAEMAKLDAWLDRSGEHRRAYSALSELWTDLEQARDDPEILALREEAARGSRAHGARRTLLKAAGIAVLGLGLGGTAFGLWSYWLAARTPGAPPVVVAEAPRYETRIGQKATVTLADGTMVIVDADSAIRDLSTGDRRQVELLHGRAYFRVARDTAHPFTVTASGRSVTALGTAFDVSIQTASVAVTLVEGKVRVAAEREAASAPPRAVEIAAGHRLLAPDRGEWTLSAADADLGWLKGELFFDEAPLADIVAELNRYSAKQIAIADRTIAGRRLSAVLRAGDNGTFLQSVETLGLARVADAGDDGVRLVAP